MFLRPGRLALPDIFIYLYFMSIRVALLDLNNGLPNQGMRCIREIVRNWSSQNQYPLVMDEFDVRQQLQVPDTSYDIYISSGGPGSPLESEGSEWENRYFNWISSIEQWNASPEGFPRKNVFFICHSFQLACRYFRVATVKSRMSTAFGVFPVHMTDGGLIEPVFDGLKDPFYAVDSRDYQVTEPDETVLHEAGATILAIEKERPHVPLERAVMAIRFNDYMIGTQFHPEADAHGMRIHLMTDDKKQTVIENHGLEKWQSMVDQLPDPDKILWTYSHILPNFLNSSVAQLVAHKDAQIN